MSLAVLDDPADTLGKPENSTGEKSHPLQRMFCDVPVRYDSLNRLLTLRIDQGWRKKAARACLENNPSTVVDLCSGTGDLSLILGKTAPLKTNVLAMDFAEPMLRVARKKIERAGLADRVRLGLADAAKLPFEDGKIDSIGIAFAFRNLTFRNPRRELYLSELARVIKPGGRLVIAETSQPSSKFWRSGFHFYMKRLVGPIGGLLSGHRGAYKYLAHSAQKYYTPDEVRKMLLDAGFSKVEQKPLLFGVAAVHVATR